MKNFLAATILAALFGLVPAYAQQGPLQDSPSAQRQQGPVSGGPAVRGVDAAAVRQMQQALDNQGFDPGAIDGIMGRQTAASLRNFQRAQGLDPTGRPDYNTLSALGLDRSGFGGGGIRQQDQQHFRELEPQAPLQPDQPLQSPAQRQSPQSRDPGQSPDSRPDAGRPPSISPQSQAPTGP